MRGVRKRHGDQRKACGKTGKLDGKNGLVNRAEFVVTGSKIMDTSVERKKNVDEEGGKRRRPADLFRRST